MKETVSDIITINDIKNWKSGEVITITAPTGKGKSHFIKNSVYDFAKENNRRILFFVHRINCYTQFLFKLKDDMKTDVIDIETYQYVSSRNKSIEKVNFDFSKYDYIVADEFHYFMSDAAFNGTTDIAMEAILGEKNPIKIFISATSNYMKGYFKDIKKLETIDYLIEDNSNFIEKLEFFYSGDVMKHYLEQAIENSRKSIFFFDSAKKAYKLHKKYETQTIFNCSANNKDFYKYVNKKQICDLLDNEGFDKVNKKNGNKDSTEGKLILITTTCFEAGIDIWDDDLKDIYCDVKDFEKLIQCIGRKRRKDGELVNLYIKALSNNQLGGIESFCKNNIRKADYLLENGEDYYLSKYGRDVDVTNTVYFGKDDEGNKVLKVNEMKYYHNYIKNGLMKHIRENFNSKHNYCEYIKTKLNAKEYSIYDEENRKDKLVSYLVSIIGKRLFKDEKKELKEVFKYNGLQARTLGINTLNGYLKDIQLPYIILNKRSSEWKNGKTKSFRYWEVIDNSENK